MGNRGKRAAARTCAGAAVVAAMVVSAAAPAHGLTIVTQVMTADQEPVPSPSRSLDRRLPEEAEARRIAAASAWHVAPGLLRPNPGDSAATAAAREQLAELAAQLQDLTTAYDAALDTATTAEAGARTARMQLRAARAALREAKQQYRHDREVLVSAITGSYTMTQLAPLATALTDGDDATVLGDLTRLEELGRSQVGAVKAADRSRQELGVAETAVDAAAQEADDRLADARDALAAADLARRSVLREARTARSGLAVLARADRAVRDALADGYPGAITFPLAPGTPFRDLDNFGGRSGHWQTTHTGDDLAAACGSPVVAANDGTVTVRTDQAWSGRWLVLVGTATGSLTTWYAHMQELSVVDGQQVLAGTPLGSVGQEGNATGCHLHFEVHPFGGSIYEDDTDPHAWLIATGAYPS